MISVLLQGGLKAVVWVDAFQAIIMFGSLLTIVVKASTFSQSYNEKMFFIIKFQSFKRLVDYEMVTFQIKIRHFIFL